MRPVWGKVQAIDEFSIPTSRMELMPFMGIIGYYRSFCVNFSTVVAPLTELLKAKSKFVCSPDCLTTVPLLVAPRWDRTFQIQVDANQVGAGATVERKSM